MKSHPSFERHLDIHDFQKMVDSLCQSAAADFVEARDRLESLRRRGPDDDRDAE